jgi:hypothetical protein
MIIDSDLRCHRTVHYGVAVDLPSPIELVGWAVALRDRQQPVAGAFECGFAASPTSRWSSCGSRSGADSMALGALRSS